MADFSVEGLAELRDSMSGTLNKIQRSFESVGDSIKETARDAGILEQETESLDNTFTGINNQLFETSANIGQLDNKLGGLKREMDVSQESTRALTTAFNRMSNEEREVVVTSETLLATLEEMQRDGMITEESVNELRDAMGGLNKETISLSRISAGSRTS